MIHLLGAIAEVDRRRILERTNAERKEVKIKNIKFGRKRSIDRNRFLSLIKEGVKCMALAKEMKISRAAVYKMLKEEEITTKYYMY